MTNITVTDIKVLKALPLNTVVRNMSGDVIFQVTWVSVPDVNEEPENMWTMMGIDGERHAENIFLYGPAIVIYNPDDNKVEEGAGIVINEPTNVVRSELDELQINVKVWRDRELGVNPGAFKTAAKMSEETGEYLGAVLKSEENRNDGIDWVAEARKEMGDVLIALCSAANAQGWSLSDVFNERWDTISQRRYATKNKN